MSDSDIALEWLKQHTKYRCNAMLVWCSDEFIIDTALRYYDQLTDLEKALFPLELDENP